jgi:DNA-binding response OmpR family regulator
VAKPSKVTILVIDDDPSSHAALRQLLDSEGWSVHVASQPGVVLPALAKGDWTLVIANLAVIGLSGPLFVTLKELALAPAIEDGKGRLRILFLLPESMSAEGQRVLEGDRLPYVMRPFNLQDVLDKVSDLLIERQAIPAPIRRVRFEGAGSSRMSRPLHQQRSHERGQGMFAKQSDYTMTEEEIADYEKQEKEEEARRKKNNPLRR